MIHLPIGGSTIGRTLFCAGWIKASTLTTRQPPSQAANLGNLLHDAMENHYQHGVSFTDQIGKTKYADLVLSDEHLPILNKMLHATEQVLDTYNIDEFMCEPFVEYIPGEAGGSIDMLGLSADGSIALILDYKTGHGAVSAYQLPQLYFYALSAMKDPKTKDMFKNVTRFVSAIVQPYVYGDEADIYEYHNDELLAFSEQVDEAIAKTKLKNPPLAAGEHCLFCPKSATCVVRREYAQTAYLMPAKERESLAKSLSLAQELRKWCGEVEQTAKYIMEEGGQITGFKQVAGRSTRIWSDEQAVKERLTQDLQEDAYKKTLLSPAQAMTALKKKGVDLESYNDLISLKAANPLIVKESDKREALPRNNLNKNLTKFFTNKSE